jgi:glycerophosphoryl diester phosphodiesterase
MGVHQMQRNVIIAIGFGYLLCLSAARAAPAIIAHRGASLDAPENTLAAFNLAWQQGADGVEGDFYLTKDGEIVCIHDDTCKRTAGKAMKVVNGTLAELRQLDAGSWKGFQWRGTPIPTVDEVLATVPLGKRIFIHIKCGPEILPALKKALAKSELRPSQSIVIATDQKVIVEAKRQMPQLKALWLTAFHADKKTGAVHPSASEILAQLAKNGADGVDCDVNPIVNEQFIQTLRAAHKEVHLWSTGADEATAKHVMRLSVASFTTDLAGWLKQQLHGERDSSEPRKVRTRG